MMAVLNLNATVTRKQKHVFLLHHIWLFLKFQVAAFESSTLHSLSSSNILSPFTYLFSSFHNIISGVMRCSLAL